MYHFESNDQIEKQLNYQYGLNGQKQTKRTKWTKRTKGQIANVT